MVQLSHPYLTPGKTIALTRRTFVGKARSLLFNTLSKFVIVFLPRNKHLLISWLQSPSAVILEPKDLPNSWNPLVLFAPPSRTAPLSSYYFLQPSPFNNILSNLNVICVCLKYSFLPHLVTYSFNSNTSQHLLYLSTSYVSVFICSMIPYTMPTSMKSTGEQHNFRKYLHHWTKKQNTFTYVCTMSF